LAEILNVANYDLFDIYRGFDFDIEDIKRCQTSQDGSSFNEFRKLIFIP